MAYNFKDIEEKWQGEWEKKPQAVTKPVNSGKKFYCLDMFPYPSGSGLHVGHWRGYVLSDIYTRMKWLEGYNILHPMGWDAFGLPAENDAIKKGIHPAISTAKNIANFKKQLAQVGALYDWSKEINTTDPQYYKWTQWIFLQMFKAGLAYEAEVAINWCPSCLTGLANEEVVQGKCERCHTIVILKKVRQWVLKITAYAEKLLEGLDRLEWPEKVKTMQRNWIGKSNGLIFNNPVENSNINLETFSAHFEGAYADTFIAIAPDHPLLKELLKNNPVKDSVEKVCKEIIEERISDRAAVEEPKGIFVGKYCVDPLTKRKLPIWVANFVLAEYGTGAVRCSAHDERDFKFAKKYNIPLNVVLVPEDPVERKKVENFEYCYSDTKNGILLEPTQFKGKRAEEVRNNIVSLWVKEGAAVEKTNYKLRDWVFSRQRYWGEPIPLIHCHNCGVVPVPENELPITLPDVESYQPTGTGESPLASIDWWVQTKCPKCGGTAKRETNTMPQWAGSCWYFLRYPNPHLTTKAFDTKDMDYWLPVDLYVGGVEHAILHLLYARFWTKVLHDLKFLSFDEPFLHLFNQGMITKYSELSRSVEKMSKSKGNVVNPEDIINNYGSDALRMYILFMGPPELDAEWQDNGLEGIKRFLNKLWHYLHEPHRILPDNQKEDRSVTKRFHRFLQDYQQRIFAFKPNTAISAAMEWLNDALEKDMRLTSKTAQDLLVALSIMIPFMASELLATRFNISLEDCKWPSYDPHLAAQEFMDIIVQVNGKTRAKISLPAGTHEEVIKQEAKKAADKWLNNKVIMQEILVPGRLINFVIKD